MLKLQRQAKIRAGGPYGLLGGTAESTAEAVPLRQVFLFVSLTGCSRC